MTILNTDNSLILIIDIQDRLLNAVFDKTLVEKKADIIAKTANILEIPVIVTEQYPKGLGNTIDCIKESLPLNTQYFEKTAFSALDNNEIKEAIGKSGRKQIIVFGIETHICVSQTVNALIEEGYEVHVIRDACGSRAEMEYAAGLNRMKDNGAHIITTEIALFEWLKGAKNPKFKEVQSLIK